MVNSWFAFNVFKERSTIVFMSSSSADTSNAIMASGLAFYGRVETVVVTCYTVQGHKTHKLPIEYNSSKS